MQESFFLAIIFLAISLLLIFALIIGIVDLINLTSLEKEDKKSVKKGFIFLFILMLCIIIQTTYLITQIL